MLQSNARKLLALVMVLLLSVACFSAALSEVGEGAGTPSPSPEGPVESISPEGGETQAPDPTPTEITKETTAPQDPTAPPAPQDPTVSPTPQDPTVSPTPQDPTVSPTPQDPTAPPATNTPDPTKPASTEKPEEEEEEEEQPDPTEEPTPVLFTVLFVAGDVVGELKVPENEILIQPKDNPVIAGQVFLHWYKEGADPAVPFAFGKPVTEDLKLIALFAAALPTGTPVPPAGGTEGTGDGTDPEAVLPEGEIPAEQPAPVMDGGVVVLYDIQQKEDGVFVNLTGVLSGFEGCEVTFQWQYNNGGGWFDYLGATEPHLTYQATEENLSYVWRLMANVTAPAAPEIPPVEIEIPAEA